MSPEERVARAIGLVLRSMSGSAQLAARLSAAKEARGHARLAAAIRERRVAISKEISSLSERHGADARRKGDS
jgi:hypothetical protein